MVFTSSLLQGQSTYSHKVGLAMNGKNCL